MRILFLFFVFILPLVPLQARSVSRIQSANISGSVFGDNHIANIVEKHGNCVVNIVSRINIQTYSSRRRPFGNLFEFFFQVPNNVIPKKAGEGSGFIIDSSGLILTNYHVIQNSDEIEVTLSDGRKFQAKLKGGDESKDLAVLKIEDSNFSGTFQPSFVAELGDSSTLRVGEWVIAIGSPFSLDRTVTVGIISAKGRSLDFGPGKFYNNLIQTDASINPGNSGGPLLDMQGKVIGINTAINPMGQGLGFAIPVNLARRIVDDITRFGRPQQSWLGVYITDVDPQIARDLKLTSARGVLIQRIVPESPAEKSGLLKGDVIVGVNGVTVENKETLNAKIQEVPVGKEARVTVLRKGRTLSKLVVVSEKGTGASGKPIFPTLGERQIGFQFRDITRSDRQRLQLSRRFQGVLVEEVYPSSPAYEAGLQREDVIIQVNRAKISSREDLSDYLSSQVDSDSLIFVIIRDGYLAYLELTP